MFLTHTHMHTHTCTRTHTRNVYIHLHTHTHTHVPTQIMCTHIYTLTYATQHTLRMCACTHTHMYTDNELPDYIMVMLVNKKTFHQISSDLQLFLGEHTAPFIEWLQQSVTTGSLTASKKNKAPGMQYV